MKKLLTLGLVFLTSLFLSAQIQDLANITNGELLSFAPIFKENLKENNLKQTEIWGYYAIFEKDVIDKRNAEYEYILFDKNLNKFANKNFNFIRVQFMGKTYSPSFFIYFSQAKELTLASRYPYYTKMFFRTINLENNTLSDIYEINNQSDRVYHKDFSWDQFKASFKNNKKEFKALKNNLAPNRKKSISPNHYITYGYEKEKSNAESIMKSISYYNTIDSTKLWSFATNQSTNKKSKKWNDYLYRFDIEHSDYLFFLKTEDYKKAVKVKDSDYKESYFYSGIICLDKKTGEVIFDTDVLSPFQLHSSSIIKSKLIENNKLVLITHDKDEKGKLNEGYKKIVINTLTGELKSDKTISLQDATSFLEIKKNNKLKRGYKLRLRDLTIHDNGSSILVFEKYKEAKNPLGILGAIPIAGYIAARATATKSKTTDLVLFNIDEEFNLIDAITFEKDVTKGYHGDYLFSQYLHEGNGSVYFFQDYKKGEKQWYLNIVSTLDKTIHKDEITISEKDKYTITPYPAKNGYILLREFNKDDKYDQIRLEKLNID